MIERDILNRLVPGPSEERSVSIDQPDFIAEDAILSKIYRWTGIAQETWLRADFGRFDPWYYTTAIGIIPVARDAKSIDDFEIVAGYQFGIVIYLRDQRSLRDLDRPLYLRMPESGRRIPLHFQTVDFTEHTHPTGGRSAAVVNIGSDDYLLTARHNVASIPSGSHVNLQPTVPWPTAAVYQKMTGCIDAALLGPITPQNSPTFTLGGPQSVNAVVGQTVNLHLGSTTAPQQATVMQTFLPFFRYWTVVQPNTFLFDIWGVHGDSGAAIATNGGDAVGMYLGETNVQDQSGQMHQMGFGIDIDQCTNLFSATLKGAIL